MRRSIERPELPSSSIGPASADAGKALESSLIESLAALEARLPLRRLGKEIVLPDAGAELGIVDSVPTAEPFDHPDELLALSDPTPFSDEDDTDVEGEEDDYLDFEGDIPVAPSAARSLPRVVYPQWGARPGILTGFLLALVPFSLIVVGAGTMIGLRSTGPEPERRPIVQAAATQATVEAPAPRGGATLPAQSAKDDESRIQLAPPATRLAEPVVATPAETTPPSTPAETADMPARTVATIPVGPAPRVAEPAAAARGPTSPATVDPGSERLAYFPERSPVSSGAARALAAGPLPAQIGSINPSAGRRLVVARDVNLRSSPDNGSGVIKIVRNGTELAALRCDIWCEVMHDGRRGFIFPSYLKNPDGSPVRKF